MIIVQILNIINIMFSALFLLCYSYQVVYLIISLFNKPKKYPDAPKTKKYAIVVSARNEENVIGQLCDCIKNQDYPSELVDILLVADNCTDKTAEVAEAHGAKVYERFNDRLIGKGFALTELFEHINKTVGYDAYDAYIVIDADNILEPNYITEMNKCFSAGNRVAVGYRNTKNYGENWISAGYGLWYLRETRQLHAVRNNLGLCSEVKGTGFLFSNDVIKRQGGWTQHLLVEDVQFTVDCVLAGEKIAYCHEAVLYDEQCAALKESWWQRMRWSRGYLQVLKRYALKMLGGFLRGKGFSHFDILMAMSPAFFITVAMSVCNILCFAAIPFVDINAFIPALFSVLPAMIGAYLLFLMLAFLTTIYEWDRINTTAFKKIWYCFTFPVFMATYIPVAACSLFVKAKWKPTKHHPVENDDLESMQKEKDKE